MIDFPIYRFNDAGYIWKKKDFYKDLLFRLFTVKTLSL